MSAQPDKFAALFKNPSIAAMHALSSRDFERFVAYVFRRAGYDVKEVGPHIIHGLDLEIRLPGKRQIFGGVECKKYAPNRLVPAGVVNGVRGAPSVSRRGAKPFVFTTSDFTDAAHQVAQAGARRVYLLNGARLLRYIRYIQGSQYDDDNTITTLSPEFFSDRETPRAVGATRILTIANNKGGVGKTTTAYYLGGALARKGNRVLLIDLDGQGNLTERCIPDKVLQANESGGQFPGIVDYFSGQQTLKNLIVPCELQEGACLVPSNPYLTLRDLGGTGRPELEARFVRDVRELCSQYIGSLGGVPDWIIIDTPPAMSVFTRAALAVAEHVLTPIRPRKPSLAGTRNMLQTVDTMNALVGTSATFLGTVVTHWDNLAVSQQFVEITLPNILKGYGGRVFTTMIPFDSQLDEREPGAKVRGPKAYEALAEEVIVDVNQRREKIDDADTRPGSNKAPVSNEA